MHILRANLICKIEDMSTFLCSLAQIVLLNKLSKTRVRPDSDFRQSHKEITPSTHLYLLWCTMAILDGEWGDLQRPVVIFGIRSLGGRCAVNLIQKERPRAP